MSYLILNGLGESEDTPSKERISEYINNLDPQDKEHGSVSVVDENENILEWSVSKNLVFEQPNMETRYQYPVMKSKAVELMIKLVEGNIAKLQSEPWKIGYGEPLSPEESKQREAELDEWQLQQDREFYDLLGLERSTVNCRHAECTKGAIEFSVFCRQHHFENIKKKACPFED